MFEAKAILPLSLSVCHTCNVKDRSDYNKAVLLTLPARREAEVVALFHATAHHRQHDFLHARWCKLHCATVYVPFASPNEETGLMLIKPHIYESDNGRIMAGTHGNTVSGVTCLCTEVYEPKTKKKSQIFVL